MNGMSAQEDRGGSRLRKLDLGLGVAGDNNLYRDYGWRLETLRRLGVADY